MCARQDAARARATAEHERWLSRHADPGGAAHSAPLGAGSLGRAQLEAAELQRRLDEQWLAQVGEVRATPLAADGEAGGRSPLASPSAGGAPRAQMTHAAADDDDLFA